jgi:UDP-4-amino-4,6-dideoxy-N-acetyl-beta-L-altrosamine N-acetyltransferase
VVVFHFRTLLESDLERILAWRTMPEVSRYMFTEIDPDAEAQRNWFRAIEDDPTREYWVIHVGERPIGVIYLSDLNRQHHRTSWGYYIGELDMRSLGGLIPPYLYNFAFARKDLDLQKVMAEVLEGNDRVMKMHVFHGYRPVGVLKNHICKRGRYQDVHLFELLRDDWERQCRFEHYRALFE